MLDAVNRRRSQPKVTEAAPSHDELLPLVAAAAGVADHGSLRPWRLIELRGDARERLGTAFVAATSVDGKEAAKLAGKPLRASLLIAVVVTHRPSFKVAEWEQDAVASGVAHTLSLLLDEAGWGVMWRTGHLTRTAPVRAMHQLDDNEELLGWLYIGGLHDDAKKGEKKTVNAREFVTQL
ncbi:nitroreductase family protein [Glaciihabitans sp. UYNi722]|uniref:nitroreductase family protein n=1 Tax=Glaciihabitans sp. UYNi722 TaxID=3156344 RepID=UPI003394B240